MKTTLLFVLMLFVFASCGGNETTPTDKSTDNPAAENSTTNSVETTDGTTTTVPASNSKITDAVVDKMCACVNGSKGEDGQADIAKIIECMDGKNSTQYVDELLGPDATEKEKTDAQNELQKRMGENCPL